MARAVAIAMLIQVQNTTPASAVVSATATTRIVRMATSEGSHEIEQLATRDSFQIANASLISLCPSIRISLVK